MQDSILPRVVRLDLSRHWVDPGISVMFGTAGLQGLDEVERAPPDRVLCFLPAPEIREEDRPDTHQDAKWNCCDVVPSPKHHIYELQGQTNERKGDQPLPIKSHEEEVVCNSVAEVVANLVCEILRHQEPLQLVGLQLGNDVCLMKRKVALHLLVVKQLTDVDASAVLVLGCDDVMDQIDLVQRLEDCIRVRVVIIRVCLVNVRDHSSVFELTLWPTRKVVAVLCVGVQILFFQLQLIFHSGCGVAELLWGRSNLDNDLVTIAAVVAEEVEPTVLEALKDGLSSLLPHLHLLPCPILRL
mmetsp:Transcript_69064/g.174079  ORF Transcript_69064/g.174079 Transcript_69064/m.174079 type:complete len:299 (-) Transcript_69064:310-1206(-)